MVVADWQPRGTHALAQEIDAVDPSALHVLTYSDIQYSFIEGSWATSVVNPQVRSRLRPRQG